MFLTPSVLLLIIHLMVVYIIGRIAVKLSQVVGQKIIPVGSQRGVVAQEILVVIGGKLPKSVVTALRMKEIIAVFVTGPEFLIVRTNQDQTARPQRTMGLQKIIIPTPRAIISWDLLVMWMTAEPVKSKFFGTMLMEMDTDGVYLTPSARVIVGIIHILATGVHLIQLVGQKIIPVGPRRSHRVHLIVIGMIQLSVVTVNSIPIHMIQITVVFVAVTDLSNATGRAPPRAIITGDLNVILITVFHGQGVHLYMNSRWKLYFSINYIKIMLIFYIY